MYKNFTGKKAKKRKKLYIFGKMGLCEGEWKKDKFLRKGVYIQNEDEKYMED